MNRHLKWTAVVMVGALVALLAAVALAEGGQRDASPPPPFRTASFAWLQPGPVPAAWSQWRLPGSPARLPAPPGWRREHGDPGTRTAVLRGPEGAIAGYLNATPQQGAETLGNWSRFRVAHNREEGDLGVRLLAAGSGLRFRAASGSCVLDSYRTATGARYREIACIVSGRSATTVIVAAAPPRRWRAEVPTLERAINDFTT